MSQYSSSANKPRGAVLFMLYCLAANQAGVAYDNARLHSGNWRNTTGAPSLRTSASSAPLRWDERKSSLEWLDSLLCGTVPRRPERVRAIRNESAPSGTVPRRPERFRAMRNESAPCGTVPRHPERFRAVRNESAPSGTSPRRPERFRAVRNESASSGTVPNRPDDSEIGLEWVRIVM